MARGGVLGGRPPGLTQLLHVALYLGDRAQRRLTWILTELAPRPPLPQQIPALVERLLGGSQLGAQFVLGLDQLVDVPEDLLLVHVTYRTRRPGPPEPEGRLPSPPGAERV